MAKKKRSRRRGFNQQTAFRLLRLAALLGPAAQIALSQQSNQTKLIQGLRAYTGFDLSTGTFKWEGLVQGYLPLLGTSLATYGIPKIVGMIRGI